MASGVDGKGFKQDMVVSIRYRNDLPPPPMPPKLLDIDTGGLSQYLTTSYASGLARREEPNIEVDAEGGMPIDMIGIPGYFLGDESAIMAPDITPVIDPADQALLLTVDQLKSQGAKDNVSFLRKTQYIGSSNARTEPLMRTNANARGRKSMDKTATAPVARDDKENIKRYIQKGFDIAYPESIPFSPAEAKAQPSTGQERELWRNPVHPDNPKLKPVSFHPILPDLGAVTDVAANWHTVKFEKPPLPAYQNRRDKRTDVAILNAWENSALMPAWQAKYDAWEKNPEAYENPGPQPFTWCMSIPKNPDSVPLIRKVFNDADPDKDDPAILEELVAAAPDGSMRIPFERARVYPSVVQESTDSERSMVLTLFDPATASPKSRLRKQGSAAYYYPVCERIRIKSDRGKLAKLSRLPTGPVPENTATENMPDQTMILTREPTAVQMEQRMTFRGQNDTSFEKEFAEIKRDAEIEVEATHADDIIQEQGTIHEGAQDVDMAEVEAGEEANVKLNGVAGRKDRDDDRHTPPPASGVDDEDAEGEDDDADAMDDD